MPTSTFFNLPPPKREKLFQAAVAEFTRQPYGEVSLSRIIQGAGISRGSFYQYFADKTDLFRYVLSQFSQELEALLLDCLTACGGRPLDMPLVLFDQVIERSRAGRESFRAAIAIIRQNVGLDMNQFGTFPVVCCHTGQRLDLSGLNVSDPDETEVLIELLRESVLHALALVCCGTLTAEESRKHLVCKIALIQRGVGIKEENPC